MASSPSPVGWMIARSGPIVADLGGVPQLWPQPARSHVVSTELANHQPMGPVDGPGALALTVALDERRRGSSSSSRERSDFFSEQPAIKRPAATIAAAPIHCD